MSEVKRVKPVKAEDRIGEVCGRFTILGISGKSKTRITLFSVRCGVCNDTADGKIYDSIKKELVKCSCSSKQIRIGELHGRFEILGISGKSKANQTLYSVRCGVCNDTIDGKIYDSIKKELVKCSCSSKPKSEYRIGELHGRFEILGISGRDKTTNRALFSVQCNVCSDTVDDRQYITIKKQNISCSCKSSKGYNKKKQGSLYVVRWSHPETKRSWIKYGIAADHEKRLKTQVNAAKHKTGSIVVPEILHCVPWEDGSTALDLETSIKGLVRANQWAANGLRGIFPDGHSECIEDRFYGDLVASINELVFGGISILS